MADEDTYARAVIRAAEIAGGSEGLAHQLQVSPELVSRWIAGTQAVPLPVFLKVVDLLMANMVAQMRDTERLQSSR